MKIAILTLILVALAGWWLYALLFFSKDEPLKPGKGFHCGPLEDYEEFWHKKESAQ